MAGRRVVAPSKKKRYVLDVTKVSEQAFLTGVQAVVRGFQLQNTNALTLIRYDSVGRVFRLVGEVPGLTWVPAARKPGLLSKFFLSMLSSSSLAKIAKTLFALLPNTTRQEVRHFGQQYVARYILDTDPFWDAGPIYVPNPEDSLLVLDIPQDLRHIEALSRLKRLAGVEMTIYLHDLIPIFEQEAYDHRPLRERAGSFLNYLDLVFISEFVICNSLYTKTSWERWCDLKQLAFRGRTEVLYLPVPQKALESSVHATRKLLAGASFDGLRILGVGAIDARKNFQIILRAIPLMAARGLNFEFKIVGGSILKVDPLFLQVFGALKRSERRRIVIKRSVSVEELAELYNQADVVVVPSLAEGYGLPVIESVIAGATALVSNSTALGELANLLGLEALSPDSEQKWADALCAAERRGVGSPVKLPQVIPANWQDFSQRFFAIVERK